MARRQLKDLLPFSSDWPEIDLLRPAVLVQRTRLTGRVYFSDCVESRRRALGETLYVQNTKRADQETVTVVNMLSGGVSPARSKQPRFCLSGAPKNQVYR